MKKILLSLFIPFVAFAQWQPDVRLTNDTATSFYGFSNSRSLVAYGSFVHTVWCDSRDGNWEIYYKRSSDDGINWGQDIRLTVNQSISVKPSIVAINSTVHIVWTDSRNGNFEIYYKRSGDGGLTWGSDTRLTNNSTNSVEPSISVSGSVLHMVWRDFRDGSESEIYYKRSTNDGVTWQPDVRLTNNSALSANPSISVLGSFVHVTWWDYRNSPSGNAEIYYKRSSDGGLTWGQDFRLTNDPSASYTPCVMASNLYLHVVWVDNRTGPSGNFEIFYKRSTDFGLTWSQDTRLTNNSYYSDSPSLSASESFVHVAWWDTRDGNPEIYYKNSTDAGINWNQDSRLTNDSANSFYPSIFAVNSVLHVLWFDNRDENDEVYYKRNPTGNSIGIHIVGSEIPMWFSLYQNYPNPFNPSTKIKFALPTSSFTNLAIYDMLGREIETLVHEQLNAGTYEVDWDGDKFSSGVYYFQITAGDFTETKKMILVK